MTGPREGVGAGWLARLITGVVGGALAAVSIFAVLTATGRLDSTTRTVTVEQTRVMPAGAPTRSGGLTARQVYERDARGVVFVSATGVSEAQSPGEYLKGENGGGQGTATGSGLEVDANGTILTNWHVVEGAVKVMVGFEHGKTVRASVLGKDPSHDIAVLRVPTGGLALDPLTLGDSAKSRVGDPVYAIGNPFGLERTLTTGVVSALQRRIQAPNGLAIGGALQTDAPINPGNSGGPLLNEQGEVIGINSQIETSGSGGGNVGIAFAIPIDVAKRELAVREGR